MNKNSKHLLNFFLNHFKKGNRTIFEVITQEKLRKKGGGERLDCLSDQTTEDFLIFFSGLDDNDLKKEVMNIPFDRE
ncbi:MAG: hypothetical protein R6X10_03905 [Desulfobacterales bacterium]